MKKLFIIFLAILSLSCFSKKELVVFVPEDIKYDSTRIYYTDTEWFSIGTYESHVLTNAMMGALENARMNLGLHLKGSAEKYTLNDIKVVEEHFIYKDGKYLGIVVISVKRVYK